MEISFPYRPEAGQGGETIYRPVAEALLRGPAGREMYQYLYIDSGADHTLVPYRVGRFLGLSAADGEVHEIHGISGAVGVIYCTIELEIGGIRFPARVAWAQLEEVPLLLGRTDVFDRFEITFRQRERAVVFRPVKCGP